MFHVGQKVVCVTNAGRGPVRDEKFPIVGSVYTIREGLAVVPGTAPGPHYYLQEIINPIYPYKNGDLECMFPHSWFRPVIERKTDISVFTRILDKVNKREPVNG